MATKPMLAELRVKVKSLAEEARMIRHEERRARGLSIITGYKTNARGRPVPIRERKHQDVATGLSLLWHRMGLRQESRAALLAYAFLRGRSYKTVEQPATPIIKDEKLMERVRQITRKFAGVFWGKDTIDIMVSQWVSGGLVDSPFARKTADKLLK